MANSHQTVILGAGIQGTCIALELARRGRHVLLLDQDDRPLNRTSVRNEGKVHLGLVYANDPTSGTADLLLEAALHFYPLLSRWLGTAISGLHRSTPFYYLVENDSLLNPDQLEHHYQSVENTYQQLLAITPHLNYLGEQPSRLYQRLPEQTLAQHFKMSRLLGGFKTEERAVTTGMLADLIRDAIANEPKIQFIPSRTVRAVERQANGFLIEGGSPDGTWQLQTEQVVNATWANRAAIDQTIGLEPETDCLHRLKYRVLARLPENFEASPSVTMVIGRYGDVVIRPDNTVYLSWYPAAMRGWSTDLTPPASWTDAVTGNVKPYIAKNIAGEILKAIDAWYPGMANAEPYQVDAGVIFAHGQTDVNDRESGLHNRTQIGVKSFDGYHSVSTGKYTTAPLFAMHTADAITPGVFS